jgi:hypothetical protein
VRARPRHQRAEASRQQQNQEREDRQEMTRHGMARSLALAAILLTCTLGQPAHAQPSPGVTGPPPSTPVKPAPQLSPDKEVKLRELVKNAKVDHAARMEFEVKLGAEVPRNLHFYPLPKEVADSVPEYREYFYVVAREQIVVIDPVNYRIVAILPV